MPDGVTAPAMPRLLVTTDAVGGVWRYAVDLAGGLADRGIETVLAVMGPPADAAQREEAEAVRGLRLVQTGLPLDWTADSPAALANASAKLAALAALTGVSAAHLHAPALVGDQPWSVPVVAVAHSCVGTWWRADPAENMVMLYLIQNAMPLEPGSAAQLATGQRMAAMAALPMFQGLTYQALGRG